MADKSFYSENWYRVAGLRLKLRRHARLHRTHFRGQLWYVLQDRSSGRFHRFAPSAYVIISMMDGTRTVQEIWDAACQQLADDTLTQDEMIRLLGQLHGADVLLGEVPPDIDELAGRGTRLRTRKALRSIMNPLAVRVPLFDPDEFIRATFPLVRPLFSVVGVVLFLGVVGYAVGLAAIHWGELTENVADRVLTAGNLLILLACYTVIKVLHELGHAYAVKRWGGSVHEVGIMLLVFLPVPYVDASDSMSFHEKWKRCVVGAAGILVEMLVAAVAMIVWVNAEDGLARAIAFNAMLIGGVSTVAFNGNPLLRFDGYYVLSDLLEIPNLGQRSNQYIGYLIKRYGFGLKSTESPATAPGEPFWFVTYGVLSFLYRIMITVAIVMIVSSQLFFLGVVLAVWSVGLMLGVPLAKQVWYLLTSPELRRSRGRAFAVTGGTLGAMVAALFAVPLPHATVAEGVVWLGSDRMVHAETDGIISTVSATPGTRVSPGDALAVLYDPLIRARIGFVSAQIDELEARRVATVLTDQAAIRILDEQLLHARADLALSTDRLRAQVVRSGAAGVLVLPAVDDLVGQFVRRGDLIGYVTEFRDPLIRVVVTEDRADLVRSRTHAVDIRFVSRPETAIPATLVREVPSLSQDLPSAALGTEGGGKIVLAPTSASRREALSKLLHLDIRLAPDQPYATIGERVYVRFQHGEEPIATQIYRQLRQVFLRHFQI